MVRPWALFTMGSRRAGDPLIPCEQRLTYGHVDNDGYCCGVANGSCGGIAHPRKVAALFSQEEFADC